MGVEHSRTLLLGAVASGSDESALEAALEESRVVVSVEPTLPAAALTIRVLITTLRRLPGGLILERGGLSTSLVDELSAASHAIDPDRPLIVGRGREATVRLHVGTGQADRAIRLVPDGNGAHVAGQRTAVIRPARPASALGAIYTAALGAAEAFKYTARVLPARRVLHRHLRFCPVSLSVDLTAAPLVDGGLDLDLTLVGVGAIGTGVVLILGALDIGGRLVAVDYQRYGPENRGTYSLGGATEMATKVPKVDLAIAALPRFDVIPFPKKVEHLPEAVDSGEMPWFPLVVSGLDTPEARRATQRLWPNRLVDAATGDTMLGIHDHVYGTGPCMRCFFPQERGGPPAAERLAELTGLAADRLMRGDDPLTESDLAGLDDERRARLVQFLGKPVCGLAAACGLSDLKGDGYQPAVPFVSLQAAALAVGRVIAAQAGLRDLPNLVQYDGLFGPQAATLEEMAVLQDCYCQTRATTIAKVRDKRRSP